MARLDPISGIEVATASARKLRDQRALAAWTMLRYTIEALEEGAALGQVIAATGYEWNPTHMSMLLGHSSARNIEEAFASWIGNELTVAIKGIAEQGATQ